MILKGKVSFKRLGWALSVLFALLCVFYFWQPYRVQWMDRKPRVSLPVVPIEQVGLLLPGRRVLIVTGHPDDDAYFIGGTLCRLKDVGAQMRLVVCTNGDKGYYPWGDSNGMAKIRQEEEKRCSAAAGVQEVVFLGLPDSRMSVDDELIGRLAVEIAEFKPDFILTFDSQFPFRVQHRDHLAAGEGSLRGAKKAGYRGELLLFGTVSPNTAVDITKKWEDVANLLAIHKSQFYGERLTMIRESVKAYKIEAGDQFGPAYADSFRACRLK